MIINKDKIRLGIIGIGNSSSWRAKATAVIIAVKTSFLVSLVSLFLFCIFCLSVSGKNKAFLSERQKRGNAAYSFIRTVPSAP